MAHSSVGSERDQNRHGPRRWTSLWTGAPLGLFDRHASWHGDPVCDWLAGFQHSGAWNGRHLHSPSECSARGPGQRGGRPGPGGVRRRGLRGASERDVPADAEPCHAASAMRRVPCLGGRTLVIGVSPKRWGVALMRLSALRQRRLRGQGRDAATQGFVLASARGCVDASSRPARAS